MTISRALGRLGLPRKKKVPRAQGVRPVNRIFQADRGRGMMFGAPS
jgi:hypothetical protein